MLDHCKRCGDVVCSYVKHCFDFIKTYTSDPQVAYKTVLEHVFFDGNWWCTNPSRQGEEVGWHELLFEALCHVVIRDVKEYQERHPDTPMSKLPRPTVLVVMPLSRSAIPLCVLLQEACKEFKIPDDVVRISLPLNIRGESVPIVHCVRHRRTLKAWDQYAGIQQNLNQEYINLTRGVEKTCMWLEKQPFGHPSRPRRKAPSSVHVDERCAGYAVERNTYIQEKKLKWYLLEQHGSIADSYRRCFETALDDWQAHRVSWFARWIWEKMRKGEWKGLPKLGQSPSDFRSLDEVLSHVVGMGTSVSSFVGEGMEGLRRVGHGSAANRWSVDDVDKKATRKVDICDWKAAMQFGHLLLPCATAEISSQPEKGLTRLCFPFLQVSDELDPENAIASLCCLTWYLAFRLERSLVTTARLNLIPHKMTITKEDGDLWFNKGCKSGRIAAAIKEKNNNHLYMYVGGGAVDHEQSHLLGGIVITCKRWRWAALVYAAARIVGLACNNSLGPLESNLVISMDSEDDEKAILKCEEFQSLCKDTWEEVNRECFNKELVDHTGERPFLHLDCRSRQAQAVGTQLAKEREQYEPIVKDFLAYSHVDG